MRLYDHEPAFAGRLAVAAREATATRHLAIDVATDPRQCVSEAQLVILATTTTTGYLPYSWLRPGSVVAHVSLDDVLPDVVMRADLVLVDDWGLVSHDERRLLGRMYRQGLLLGPDGARCPSGEPDASARAVDGNLGEVLDGVRPGRRSPQDIILSNPFGMSVLDVAVADEVLASARRVGVGSRLPA